MGAEIKKSVNDQALGLRRQAQRIAPTYSLPVFSPAAKWVPVINVYRQLGAIAGLSVKEGLFWHWMSCEKGATGWDAQARMHVRGTNAHFHDWQVSQWRFVAGEWHLFTKTPEPLLFADRLWIGLPSSRKELILLYETLKSPCKILQGVPIILVGDASGFAQQLVSLLRRSLNLEIDRWNGTETKSVPAAEGGYYRLLDSCHSRAGRTAFPPDTSKIGTVQYFQGGFNQHAKR
jgi:hypothetical protein